MRERNPHLREWLARRLVGVVVGVVAGVLVGACVEGGRRRGLGRERGAVRRGEGGRRRAVWD